MMEYIDIYQQGDETNRFVLGKQGRNPLFVIGLNPSTADVKKSDPTMRKVMGIAERFKCDSFVMLNLYPQRTTNPSDLHKELSGELFKQNLQEITKALSTVEKPLIFVAWGDNIGIRKYLYRCAKEIITQIGDNAVWLQTGALTKNGHPRHPLYANYDWALSGFDFKNYVEYLKSIKL